MDSGGSLLVIVEIVGVALLGLILLYMAMRTRSRGKQDSSATTERATRDLYREEEADRRSEDS